MDLRVSLLLSIQRALWDVVTPDLRGVALRVSPFARVRFIFDAEPDDQDLENVSEAETGILADFGEDVHVSAVAVCVAPPQPRLLEQGEEWVYLRQER